MQELEITWCRENGNFEVLRLKARKLITVWFCEAIVSSLKRSDARVFCRPGIVALWMSRLQSFCCEEFRTSILGFKVFSFKIWNSGIQFEHGATLWTRNKIHQTGHAPPGWGSWGTRRKQDALHIVDSRSRSRNLSTQGHRRHCKGKQTHVRRARSQKTSRATREGRDKAKRNWSITRSEKGHNGAWPGTQIHCEWRGQIREKSNVMKGCG